MSLLLSVTPTQGRGDDGWELFVTAPEALVLAMKIMAAVQRRVIYHQERRLEP
jgi:glycine cleavage system aminomethyltransferase T